MLFTERYNRLNVEQKKAVDLIDGPVMVIAGPGSGKTELLSMRVANILRKADVDPNNILCLTFTDAAAKNMRERLTRLIGNDAYKVAIHTFHSFAIDMMHRFRESFFEADTHTAITEVEQIEIISQCLENFPLSNAFSKKNPEGGFVYLRSILNRIGVLKKAGISPQEYADIIQSNAKLFFEIEQIFLPIFKQRVSKKIISQLPKIMESVRTIAPQQVVHDSILSYPQILADELEEMYVQANEQQSTKPISAFKAQWFKKDPETAALMLKDRYHYERNLSLAQVYKQYQEKIRRNERMDFDDMILDLLEGMKKNPGILASLQEQFQYILVDEFQDSNDAQMRIITQLTTNPVNEGKPNILLVGDDDQAIYKFQGAKLNNIIRFTQKYPATQVICLVKNYRSTKPIVQFAQHIINQGEQRLIHSIDSLEKQLEAANPNLKDGHIAMHSFDTAIHEYSYIAEQIQKQLDSHVPAEEIALIARNHRELKTISKVLAAKNIPFQYEKRSNVLEDRHIQELLLLARVVHSLATQELFYANEHMPELLSANFLDLDRAQIWKLSIQAHQQEGHNRWIDAMLDSLDEKIRSVAMLLLFLADESKKLSLAEYIDKLLGPAEGQNIQIGIDSPFRQYYFSQKRYTENPGVYLGFLSALNTLLEAVYTYTKANTQATLNDFIQCIDIYNTHNLQIVDTAIYSSGRSAVQLLTAHKAKGLEFDVVFVVSCQKDIWAATQRRELIAFPQNLPIDPALETLDDFLRLFFVAITRAKRILYVTNYIKKTTGRESLQLPFLSEMQDTVDQFGHKQILPQEVEKNLSTALTYNYSPLAIDEKTILTPVLENYVMSVTHLNNFLDVSKGGPQYFFQQNLLRFPRAYLPHMAYGTAMHATIEGIYRVLKSSGSIPDIKTIHILFEQELKKQHMEQKSFEQYAQKGKNALAVYIQKAKHRISAEHWIEKNFRSQQVMIDAVQITGKIDKIVPIKSKKQLEVYDFKTGKPQYNWIGKDTRKQITLHEYKRQLTFYKLLIEGSRDYSNYEVNKGFLEFLTPTSQNEIILLEHNIVLQDAEKLKKLIQVVYNRIMNLDFPDISNFSPDISGVIAFEEWLLEHG